jgi:hypothetical protein
MTNESSHQKAVENSNRIREVKVTLFSLDQRQVSGVALIQEWSQPERLNRALKTLGIFWGLTFVAIFIPGLHFILVPSLFVLGPFLALRAYQIESAIAGGGGPCPHCGKDFALVKAPVKWPLNDLCSNCRTFVKVQPQAQDL